MQKQRAALYLRISQDRTGDEAGVSRQREDGRRLARRSGWTVVGEYTDNDTSAAGRQVRPEYERLLRDVEAGRVDVVIAWNMYRLLRTGRDRLRMLELGRDKGLTLAFVRGSVLDLSTPAGRLVGDLLGSVSQHEIDEKGDRHRRANLQARQAGRMPWTRRPFGYDTRDGQIVVVAREARELRRAARAIVDGERLAAVVRGMRVPTSTGGEWSNTSLRRALLNPRVAGQVSYKGEVLGEGEWPRILAPDLAAAVREILADPKRLKHKGNRLKYWLSGVCECGRCGGPMYATTNSGVMVYRCPACYLVRRMDHIDNAVEAVILARLALPDAAVLLTPSTDVAELRKAADELRNRRAGISALLADGLLTASDARPRLRELAAELAAVERDIAAAAGTSALGALATAEDVAAVWEGLDVESRRDVAEALLTPVVLPAGKGVRWNLDQLQILWKP